MRRPYGLQTAACGAVTKARSPSPASKRMRRALSCWWRATSMRRGRMPSEPSMMLMFWSTMACSMPASFRSASAKEMSTGSLLRRSSIMGPTLAVLARPAKWRPRSGRACAIVSLSAARAALYALAKRSSVVGVVLSFEETPCRARVDLAAGRGDRRRAWSAVNRLIVERTELRRRADPGGGALSDRFRRQAPAPDGDDRLGAGLRLSRRRPT